MCWLGAAVKIAKKGSRFTFGIKLDIPQFSGLIRQYQYGTSKLGAGNGTSLVSIGMSVVAIHVSVVMSNV